MRRRPARDLRIAIDCLPLETRRAMLTGVEANRIIVGAYTDRNGGVCPMLAAHRNGGRTSLASFAHAWDRYTGVRRRPRPATDHELHTLTAMLEASIALDELPALEDVVREVKKLRWEDGRLTLGSNVSWSNDTLEVTITAPQLVGLELHGAGDVELRDLDQTSLTIETHGAANVEADGKVQTLAVATHGAGNLDLEKVDARVDTVTVGYPDSAAAED